jgi:transcriptional regulator with XRE-family HTH domain
MDGRGAYPSSAMAGRPSDDQHLRAVLAQNLNRLMETHATLNSNPKVAEVAKIGSGTVSRLRNGEVSTNLETLSRLAEAFDVMPWQLLVPGIEPSNPPVLRSAGESEKEFYRRLKQVAEEHLQDGGSQ